MPIHWPKNDFIDFFISSSPDKSGVYALWDNDEVIFYGWTKSSIRDELYKHIRGRHGPCTRAAVHFNYQPTLFPDYRFRELIREFESEHGRSPRCNNK